MKPTKKDYLENYAKYPKLSKKVLDQLLKEEVYWADIISNLGYSHLFIGSGNFYDAVEFGRIVEKDVLELLKKEKIRPKALTFNNDEETYYFYIGEFAIHYVVDEIKKYVEMFNGG